MCEREYTTVIFCTNSFRYEKLVDEYHGVSSIFDFTPLPTGM